MSSSMTAELHAVRMHMRVSLNMDCECWVRVSEKAQARRLCHRGKGSSRGLGCGNGVTEEKSSAPRDPVSCSVGAPGFSLRQDISLRQDLSLLGVRDAAWRQKHDDPRQRSAGHHAGRSATRGLSPRRGANRGLIVGKRRLGAVGGAAFAIRDSAFGERVRGGHFAGEFRKHLGV
jgi:hypothetical protein